MGSSTGEFWSFWIRRGAAYPVTAAVRTRHVPAINENKENVPPPRCRARGRKSPLPDWYPRTPLRDITVIVNALERRRRRRMRAQQGNPDPEVSPMDDSKVIDPSRSPASVSPLSPIEHPLETFSPCSSNPSVEDKKQSDYEKKLESSIDRIETLVMENLKSSSKPAPTKSRRTFMLMR